MSFHQIKFHFFLLSIFFFTHLFCQDSYILEKKELQNRLKEILSNQISDKNTLSEIFCNAAANNDHATIEIFLQFLHKCPIDCFNKSGFTPLIYACGSGNLDIVEKLIKNGANVNGFTQSGISAIAAACLRDQKEVAKFLLKNGANINLVNKRGETALCFIATEGSIERMEFLIENGANVNAGHVTPLMYASAMGKDLVVDFLIKKGANINALDERGTSALIYALQEGQLKIAKLLIKHGVNINHKDNHGLTPFCGCIVYGKDLDSRKLIDGLNLLIQEKAEINRDEGLEPSALLLAIYPGRSDIIEFLISKGFYITITAVEWAIVASQQESAEQKKILKILLSNASPEVIARAQEIEQTELIKDMEVDVTYLEEIFKELKIPFLSTNYTAVGYGALSLAILGGLLYKYI